MTYGERRLNQMLNSTDCHIIDGIYFYHDHYNKSAIVLKAEASLRNVIIPETISLCNGEIVIPIEELYYCAFAGTDIESVVIPKTVKKLQQCVFRGCKKLKSIKFCGDIEKIEEECFQDCTSIERIILPKYVGSVERACFMGCTSLKEFVLPDNMTSIPCSMFAGCPNLLSLNLPPQIIEIEYNSFSSCDGLKEIVLGENIIKVNWEAFKNCKNLRSLTISNPQMEIGSESFGGCTSLKTIHVPSIEYRLNDSSFIGCTNLDNQVILQHTEYGDYLRKRWKEDLKAEKQRKLREKKWYPIWDGVQTALILLMLVPIAIIGYFLFAIFASSVASIIMVLGFIIILLFLFGFILEKLTGESINFDLQKLLNSKFLIVTVFALGTIIAIVYLYIIIF